jgi:hypothetical protein
MSKPENDGRGSVPNLNSTHAQRKGIVPSVRIGGIGNGPHRVLDGPTRDLIRIIKAKAKLARAMGYYVMQEPIK